MGPETREINQPENIARMGGSVQIITPGGGIAEIMPCGHDVSNRDRTVESGTVFCRLCDLQGRCQDAEGREKELVGHVRLLREALRPCLAILIHKKISPPMMPEVQERMAESIKTALTVTA